MSFLFKMFNSDEEPAGDYQPVEMYLKLRSQALALRPDEVGISDAADADPIAALMEIGYPEAVVTLAAIVDGSVSLYFSNGGGIIGAGEHEPVRAAARAFIDEAGGLASSLSTTDQFPLPHPGHARFFVVGPDGVVTGEASDEPLTSGRHDLAPLFMAGHQVLTAIRESTAAA